MGRATALSAKHDASRRRAADRGMPCAWRWHRFHRDVARERRMMAAWTGQMVARALSSAMVDGRAGSDFGDRAGSRCAACCRG